MDAERRGRGSSVGVAVGLATQQVGKREGGRFSISLHQLSTLEIEAQRVENVTRVCARVLNRRSSTDYNIFITRPHLWIHFVFWRSKSGTRGISFVPRKSTRVARGNVFAGTVTGGAVADTRPGEHCRRRSRRAHRVRDIISDTLVLSRAHRRSAARRVRLVANIDVSEVPSV